MKEMRDSLSKAWTFVGLFLLLGIFIGDLISLVIFDVSFTNKLVSIVLKDEPEFIVTKEICRKEIDGNKIKELDEKKEIIINSDYYDYCNILRRLEINYSEECSHLSQLLNDNELENWDYTVNESKLIDVCSDEEVDEIEYWNGVSKSNATYQSTYGACISDCSNKKIDYSKFDNLVNWSNERRKEGFSCYEYCDNNYMEKINKTIKVEDLTLKWVSRCGIVLYDISIYEQNLQKDYWECGEYKIRRKE